MSNSPSQCRADSTGLESIRVRGARTHNLQNVDLDLPRHKLIVFCGVSGSGKTSMALDTLYAEGQRRYIESFSAYTRQFLEQLDKPDADSIDGIPAAIAVTHRNASRSKRATVGSTTEIADHLRLLFARVGRVVCPDCHVEARSDSVDSIVDQLTTLPDGTRAMLGFSETVPEAPQVAGWLAGFTEAGYVRAIWNGSTANITPVLARDLHAGEPLVVLVDRLTLGSANRERIAESVETTLGAGTGDCIAFVEAADGSETIDDRTWQRHTFSRRFRCPSCNRGFAEPQPELFHSNNPLGACPTCNGGNKRCQEPFQGADQITRRRLPAEKVPDTFFPPCPDCHGAKLNPEALAVRIAGKNFAEVCAMKIEDSLQFFQQSSDPPPSGGEGGNANSNPTPHELNIARIPLEHIRHRLQYLVDVGVGYLTLDRRLRTLSDGEAQRVAMTATLSSNLVDMLYVLDEPTVGLHPADVPRLTQAITRLRDRGNTVIAIEHEEQIIRTADNLVEFGPGAGIEGGRVTFQGTPQELERDTTSHTGDWLAGRRTLAHSGKRRTPTHGRLTLVGARANNLQNLTVDFPLGLLCLVTGVSGAGKSSLVRHTLYPAIAARLNKSGAGARNPLPPRGRARVGAATSHEDSAPTPNPSPSGGGEKELPSPSGGGEQSVSCPLAPVPYTDLLGAGQLTDVAFVDQSPIGRSPRSNPVTYIKAFDPIRALFAEQTDAKMRGFTASHFSFNVPGGRCEACQGAGYLQVDMQFMADIFMRCPECAGRRYRREVLDVKYRGRDIAEVLDLTALEAFRFFRGQKKLQARLKSLLDVGLDYLRLGQPANTLSGGEAQRLKLAEQLAVKRTGRTLFLLDEPTTGLHFSDIVKLVDCFDALIEVGHSIIVIEHNLELIQAADWLIDLGPGAADEGGRVVAQGTPEEVAGCAESVTGRVLAT